MLFTISWNKEVRAQKTNVRFKVVNRVDSLGLSKASITLIRDKDSAFLGFGITDSLGAYRFNNLKLRTGTSFVVSSLGFIAQQIPVTPTDSSTVYHYIALQPDTALLADVIIESGTAVRMNGDTLEYNTDFFKTMPNAVVEELLKKIPGIEFRSEDEIYADGQRVSKITVDNKDFFSSDPKVLLKNLPADLIKKVQIVDEKNTVATETRQKEDIPKIINLKLKKAVRQGILGKLFGGYGSDKRYETGGLVNLFRDTFQVSLIGTSNNQSSQGFSMDDLNEMGGFDRSSDMGGEQGYSLSGYGSSGIPKKSLAGTNINYNFTKDIKLNLQYFYKQNSTYNEFDNTSQIDLGDTTRYAHITGLSRNSNNTHQIHGGFSWKQDSTGYLNYNFSLNQTNTNNLYQSNTQTRTTNVELFSTASNKNSENSKQNNLSTDISYDKTLTKSKIDISLNGNYNHGLNAADGYNDNITTQYIKGYIPDSILRHELSHLPTTNYSIGASINKTISDHHMLMLSGNYTTDLSNSGDDVYQRYSLIAPYEYTPGQSIKYENKNEQVNSSLSYRYHDAKSSFNFSIGGKYDGYNIVNTYSDASIGKLSKHYNFLSPVFSINYKSVGFSFSRAIQPPSSYYLSPITDSSSNLYYHTGNPDLSASTSSNFALNLHKYWSKSQYSVYANLNWRQSQNNVISKTDVDEDGITRTSFINYGTGSNSTLNIGINKGFHKKDFNLGTGLSFYATQNKTPLYLNAAITETTNQNLYTNLYANASYKELIQLDGGIRLNYGKSYSQDNTYAANKTHSVSTYLNLKWRPIQKLVFQWNNRYNTQSAISAGQKTNWFFSDASIAYSVDKKENIDIRISGYDLFNQNTGFHQYAYQNQLYSSQSLVQKRYFMLTISYKFRKISN